MKVCRDNEGTYLIYCPGCKHHHGVWVDKPNANGAQWTFDGNMESPTFNPSLLYTIKFGDTSKKPYVCHSFIRNGNIQYLNDCTHEYSGKTLLLEDI